MNSSKISDFLNLISPFPPQRFQPKNIYSGGSNVVRYINVNIEIKQIGLLRSRVIDMKEPNLFGAHF